ncbi:AAA family ATPase [Curvibacter cyanobacteriorum]|nr:AAA family ATPase [Curvibacter sp. HBC61]
MNEAPLAATSEASQEKQQTLHDFLASGVSGQGRGARFTRLEYSAPIGKAFFVYDGELQKRTNSNGTDAVARIVECHSIQDLEDAFKRATHRDVFVGGVPYADRLLITTKDARAEGKIARSKDDLPFPRGPGVMFLDNDHPTREGDDQFEAYAVAVPALAKASYVFAPSSSAWLHDPETVELLKGAGGQHYGIPVQDATDIPRAMKALHDRLVLAGMGAAIVTQAGSILIRSPVDLAMRSPNQPLFQRADCGAGVVQKKVEHIGSHAGEVFLFDTRLIADLSPSEIHDLVAVEDKLRASVDIKAHDVRTSWVEARVLAVAAQQGVSDEQARRFLHVIALASTKEHIDIWPGLVVEFADGTTVDVSELLKNPHKYDGNACCDPVEPEYRGGALVGKFYAESLTIHSFAHGGRTFHLQHEPVDISGILAQVPGLMGALTHDGEAPLGPSDTSEGELPSINMTGWAPPTEPHPLARFVDISDLPKVPRMIIPGLIMHGVVCISGSRGVGKTTCLLPLAAAAAGLHAPGYEFAPKHWRHVIYISEQLEQAAIIMEGLVNHAGLGIQREDVNDRMHFVDACRLPPEKVAEVGKLYKELFTRHIDGVKIDPLVVFDTKSAVLSLADENDNAEGSKAMAHLKQGFEGLPVWIIGHVTKASMNQVDASALTQRGAGSFEDDAVQTAYLIADTSGARRLCLGKKRFEAECDSLVIECGFAKTRALDEFGDVEDVGMRWGIVKKPLGDSAVLRFGGAKSSKEREEGDRRERILDTLRAASKRGEPLNRTDLREMLGGNAQKLSETVTDLCNEGWVIEVDVPAERRRTSTRKKFLVALTTEEHDAVTIDGKPVPPHLLQIPPSWCKPTPPVPGVVKPVAKNDEESSTC